MKFRVLIEQNEDGVFVAQVPSLPGCISQGRTRQEAIKNAKEAISAYLESVAAHDEPIPPSMYGDRRYRGGRLTMLNQRYEPRADLTL